MLGNYDTVDGAIGDLNGDGKLDLFDANNGDIGQPNEVWYNTSVTSFNDNRTSPFSYQVFQNFPNPFNPTTTIKYGLPEQSNVTVEIFNTLGQSVGLLVNGQISAGNHEAIWNAENLPSGMYLISIQAEGLSSRHNFTQVKKALLLK